MAADIRNQQQKYIDNNSKQNAGKSAKPDQTAHAGAAIQAKLVLLVLNFPRLRIIWSSSPFASADIFRDLKTLQYEPDVARAMAIGAPTTEGATSTGSEINSAAEDLLRTFPGVTAKNVGYVMSRVSSVRRLCELNLSEMQDVLGAEPGKACWEFLHRKK